MVSSYFGHLITFLFHAKMQKGFIGVKNDPAEIIEKLGFFLFCIVVTQTHGFFYLLGPHTKLTNFKFYQCYLEFKKYSTFPFFAS